MPLERAHEDLLDELARVAAKHGAERLLRPFVLPTREFFPEPWREDLVGVATVLHRLLGYAGLTLPFELDDEREPLEQVDLLAAATRAPIVSFYGVEDGKLAFEVERIGPPDLTVAALCHVVGTALVISKRPDHPPPQPADLREGSIAAMYCGFGPLIIEAARAQRRAGEVRGSHQVTYAAEIEIGALHPEEALFLLAVLCVVREERALDPLRAPLDATQKVDFERWLGSLMPEADSLRRRLGTPLLSSLPPSLPKVGPLPEPVRADCEAKEEAHRKPHTGKEVERVWTSNAAMWALLGGLAGIPLLFFTWRISGGLATPLVTALAGRVLGKNARIYYCGACSMRLYATETKCPKCGVGFSGDKKAITKASEMPDD